MFHARLPTVVFAVFAAMLAGCQRTPGDIAVRDGLVAAEAAAEHTDAPAFLALLASDFTGNRGELDRRDLGNLLRVARFRHETIHAALGPVSMEARGDRYLARFVVTLTSGGRLLPSDLGVYRVATAWRRDGSAWRCYSATWTRSL